MEVWSAIALSSYHWSSCMWVVVFFCVRTKLGEAEKSTIESALDVNASAAWEDLIDHGKKVQENVRANTQPFLRPTVIENGFIQASIPSWSIWGAKAGKSGPLLLVMELCQRPSGVLQLFSWSCHTQKTMLAVLPKGWKPHWDSGRIFSAMRKSQFSSFCTKIFQWCLGGCHDSFYRESSLFFLSLSQC